MNKVIINKKLVIIAVGVGFALCLMTLILQVFIFPYFTLENDTKFRVAITPLPVDFATRTENVGANGAESHTQTPAIPGVFAPGMRVVISGTGNEGLNIRQEPGTENPVLYLAQEGETYVILEGPVIEDGLIWWTIKQDPEGRKTGWAVQDYFSPLN